MYLPLALFLPPSLYFTHKQFNLLYQFWIHTEVSVLAADKPVNRDSSLHRDTGCRSSGGTGMGVEHSVSPSRPPRSQPLLHRLQLWYVQCYVARMVFSHPHVCLCAYFISFSCIYGYAISLSLLHLPAGVLIIWDRMFGTFQPELREEKVVYGLVHPLSSWNPFLAQVRNQGCLQSSFPLRDPRYTTMYTS